MTSTARKPAGTALKRGWTTGACATAATRAAYTAWLTGEFPDPVTITLPKGQQPAFALARESLANGFAEAGIIKDAGDDPDVTHGALIVVRVSDGPPGSGVTFAAGPGVGTVTKPGLPIPAGEPAINPVPRRMMCAVVEELAAEHAHSGDVVIEISIPDGASLAAKTWNPRLGIVGGLSILGTTGVVIPYSCAAWIHSIHRGVDVALATGLTHVAGCTGSTSELAVQRLYGLGDGAMLDMGDFAGGMLKYLRQHPVPRLTIGGGFGKLSKLAAGHLDLHSGRSQVDTDRLLAELDLICPGTRERAMSSDASMPTSAGAILQFAGPDAARLAERTARQARDVAVAQLRNDMQVDVVIVDRAGTIIGQSDA
ncbi:MAG: cobalt-precorrin-5B (C(1))-methyltransferase [Pseudomonadota bacterium]